MGINCEFDSSKCGIECEKYSMCAFYSIQNQLNGIQSQLNFLFDTVKTILQTNEMTDSKFEYLDKKLASIVQKIDSETINKFKESIYEKENK